MAEPVYLYGQGRRKHIAVNESGLAYCGDWFMHYDDKARAIRRWNTAAVAERQVERLKAMAVCKHCEAAHAKREASHG